MPSLWDDSECEIQIIFPSDFLKIIGADGQNLR